MDERGGRDGGEEQSPHCLGERNWPDVSVPREDLGKNKAGHGGGDHEDWIGNVRRAEDDPHQERAQVAAVNGFHKAVMKIGLREILLESAPGAVPEQRFDGVPVHRHNRQGMPGKTEYEKRNVEGQGNGQDELGIRPHSGYRKAEASESIVVQNVADKDDAPERHPNVRKRVLPAPDVCDNPGVNQYCFQGRIDRRPGMGDARGFKSAH